MTENRFFTWVWRFNGLAIAVAVTLIIGIIGWEMSRDWRQQAFPTQTHEVLNVEAAEVTGDTTTPPEVDQTLRFGAPIYSNKRALYAVPQYAEQEYENQGISKSSGGNRVNFLIVNRRDKSQEWLFPSGPRLIREVDDLGYRSASGSNLVMGRLLNVVESDTNQDGRLSGNDLASLYFVSLSWDQPILLAKGVEHVLSSKAISGSKFDVMYVSEDGAKLAHFGAPFVKPDFEIILEKTP